MVKGGREGWGGVFVGGWRLEKGGGGGARASVVSAKDVSRISGRKLRAVTRVRSGLGFRV